MSTLAPTQTEAVEGVYVQRLDMESGTLSPISAHGEIENPSFLDLSPDRRFLYAIGEVGQVDGRPGGAIGAYAIDSSSGTLTHLNTESTVGPGPCHVSVDATGRYVLVANYGGGSVAILPVRDDGSLGEASDFVQHEGSSVNPNRQGEPHAHSIMVSPNNTHAFAPDLGMDKIAIYQIDHGSGKLAAGAQPFMDVDPGEGPRHFDFHPNGPYAYVINELGNTIVSYDYDAEAGTQPRPVPFRRCPKILTAPATRPISTSIPTESFSTAPTEDTIAWLSAP